MSNIKASSAPTKQQALSQLRAFQQLKPNFQMAINTQTQQLKNANYIGPSYADGTPFQSYKQPADYNSDWFGSSAWNSITSLQQNLPTDNTASRNAHQANALGSGNNALKGWVFSTQTKANPSSSTYSCTNNNDCSALGPNYTCNSNYSPWPDSFGNNQAGGVCVPTIYPEMSGGTYTRTLGINGGIGKKCKNDNDCDLTNGYSCNNTTDLFGKNVQQTGYCAMSYNCGTEKRYLGYPYNSGIPLPPDPSQNANNGYASMAECQTVATAQQNCVKADNGRVYAVFPGYCPVQPNLRLNSPQGALPTSNTNTEAFQIPAYANSLSSTFGSSHAVNALNVNNFNKENSFSPLQYLQKINPPT